MKKILQVLLLLVVARSGWAKESIDPAISPALFQPDMEITVTYDVTGTPLANLTNAFAWVWIPGQNINAKYNVNPASADVTKTNHAKFVRSEVDGKVLFTLTFTPSMFFETDISAQTQMGILLKGNDWNDGQTTDFIATFWDGSFQISLTSPTRQPLFVTDGDQIEISAETPVEADFSLYINETLVNTQTATSVFSYTYTVIAAEGNGVIRLEASTTASSTEKTFQYLISTASPEVAKPNGIIAGINYGDDGTKVTLCLWAPGKESVYVLGDFTDWKVSSDHLMNRSGEFFWITIEGLTTGTEYAFQYLINESVYVADPYADKILDPDDQYIPSNVYPDLKDFPQDALKDDWYFNRVSVLQTGQQAYQWQVTDFAKPEKEELVVYELLIRDFFNAGERSYENLADTINYFKRLGVNAIELMPIMEFNGNESWGYNPTFMFAPDKYYGDKNSLKAFIDACHANGIAVILDIALNHQDMPNTYVMMDFDFSTGKPEADNKWFNVEAKHPFNVFFDMNHESPYTKAYVDTINYYWLNEYKVDGFRFDLSKGFTQVNNPNNVDAWSAYDASRVALLKRMADKIWSHTPDAYVILEHLAVNTEEKELAEYRAEEGKGMMLWGKITEPYNQLTMGYTDNSNITNVYFGSRGWTAPHLVSYMESHDEERLMYKNLMYGKESPDYSVKDTLTALGRQAAANVLFYTVPGPKMLWEFGELGYDYSINYCEDGSNNNNCRVSPKPVRWNYASEPQRSFLYQQISELLKIRSQYDVFTRGTPTFSTDNSLIKQIMLKNEPYVETPTSADEMNVVVISNFDLVERETSVNFPHSGTWYDFYAEGNPLEVTSATGSVNLPAGGYKLFTDFPIESSTITAIEQDGTQRIGTVNVFPNPARTSFSIAADGMQIKNIVMYSTQGQTFVPKAIQSDTWGIVEIPAGMYILKIETNKGIMHAKIVKY